MYNLNLKLQNVSLRRSGGEAKNLLSHDFFSAHIFFGLLAYWIVNTIRYQLKQSEECSSWKEILRRMSTQKLVTTTAINALGDKVEFRQCSCPSKQAAEIYRKLNLKEAPFKKQKICRTQKSEKILQSADSGELRAQ